MTFTVVKKVDWYFPPTTNKHGISREKYDTKTIIIIESDLFTEPIIAMSDIHSHTPELCPMLDDLVNLSEFIVITAGDMAGENIYGTDGNPTPEYEYFNERSKEFYYVQGNHDLPDPTNKHISIKNKVGKLASISDGTIQNTGIGSIGAVNGIISNKVHPYKTTPYKYLGYLKKVLSNKPNILVTHDTPSIMKNYKSGDRYIGSEAIYNIVNEKKPKVHMYGHCHHPEILNTIGGVNYISLDGRVLIILPISKGGNLMYDYNRDNRYFKNEAIDLNSPSAHVLYEYEYQTY